MWNVNIFRQTSLNIKIYVIVPKLERTSVFCVYRNEAFQLTL